MRWVSRALWAARKIFRGASTESLLSILVAVLFALSNNTGSAQQPIGSAHATQALPPSQPGDQPSDPGPLATGISPALNAKQIRTAMKKVADWELARVQAQPPSRSWDFGVLDIGLHGRVPHLA